mmetsp:Transcript_4780/g.17880  ORF Transcript_4780/g.17880 Transcript_4780/m.17880 type:complete len:273 (+) Transcript_4780:2235-3053(+)
MVSTHSSVLGFSDLAPDLAPAPKSTSGPQYTEKQVTRPWPTGHWSLTSMCDTSVSTAWYTGRSASPVLAMRIFSTRFASATSSTTATSSMSPARLDGLSSSAADDTARLSSASTSSSYTPDAARLPLPFPLVLCSEILSPLNRKIFGGLSSFSSSLSALSTASSGNATALLMVMDRLHAGEQRSPQNLECRRTGPAAKPPFRVACDVDACRANARVALARTACDVAARQARSPAGVVEPASMVEKFVVVFLKTVCATLRRSWLSIPRRGDRT